MHHALELARTPAQDVERKAQRVLRRAQWNLRLELALRALVPALFAAGAGMLVLRRFGGSERAQAAWCLVLLLPVLVLALYRAHQRRPQLATALSWLERESGGSGLLFALAHSPDPSRADPSTANGWRAAAQARLAAAPELPLAIAPRRLWALVLPALFALLALALPITPAPTPLVHQALGTKSREALEQQLAELAELGLEPERIEQLAAQLERASELAQAGQGELAWQALDGLAEGLAQERQARDQALLEARQQLETALSMLESDAGAAPSGASDPALQRLQQAAQALAQALAGAGLRPEQLGAEAAAAAQAAAADSAGSEQAARLGDGSPAGASGATSQSASLDLATLKLQVAGLDRRLDALAQQKLLDPDKLRAAREFKERQTHRHTPECRSGGT